MGGALLGLQDQKTYGNTRRRRIDTRQDPFYVCKIVVQWIFAITCLTFFVFFMLLMTAVSRRAAEEDAVGDDFVQGVRKAVAAIPDSVGEIGTIVSGLVLIAASAGLLLVLRRDRRNAPWTRARVEPI